MKHFLQVSTFLILSLSLCAIVANADVATPPSLTVTCGDANSTRQPYENGHCTEGMVTFRGPNFPASVYVKVLSYPAGVLIDHAGYDAQGGQLSFTQTLIPAGSYSVIVTSDEAGEVVLTSMMVTVDAM